MDKCEKIRNLSIFFKQLENILINNNGNSFLNGTSTIIKLLSNNDISEDMRLADSSSIFKHMMGGMGSLGDFCIYNIDTEIQDNLNLQLDKILKEIWDLLENY